MWYSWHVRHILCRLIRRSRHILHICHRTCWRRRIHRTHAVHVEHAREKVHARHQGSSTAAAFLAACSGWQNVFVSVLARPEFQDLLKDDFGNLSLHMVMPIAPLECPLAQFRVQAVPQALVDGPRDKCLEGLPGTIDALRSREFGEASWLSSELAAKILLLMHGLKGPEMILPGQFSPTTGSVGVDGCFAPTRQSFRQLSVADIFPRLSRPGSTWQSGLGF